MSDSPYSPEMLMMAIRSGLLDSNLEEVQRHLNLRRSAIATQRLSELSIGDRITLVQSIKPKLLAGAYCEVTGFNGTDTVIVKLLGTYSDKWYIGKTVTIPKGLVGLTVVKAGA